jgi:hypothetical protein
MPMRGELKPVPVRSGARTPAADTRRNRLAAAIANPDLQGVLFFCAIGFLATINVVLRFPHFGETVAQLAMFP